MVTVPIPPPPPQVVVEPLLRDIRGKSGCFAFYKFLLCMRAPTWPSHVLFVDNVYLQGTRVEGKGWGRKGGARPGNQRYNVYNTVKVEYDRE